MAFRQGNYYNFDGMGKLTHRAFKYANTSTPHPTDTQRFYTYTGMNLDLNGGDRYGDKPDFKWIFPGGFAGYLTGDSTGDSHEGKIFFYKHDYGKLWGLVDMSVGYGRTSAPFNTPFGYLDSHGPWTLFSTDYGTPPSIRAIGTNGGTAWLTSRQTNTTAPWKYSLRTPSGWLDPNYNGASVCSAVLHNDRIVAYWAASQSYLPGKLTLYDQPGSPGAIFAQQIYNKPNIIVDDMIAFNDLSTELGLTKQWNTEFGSNALYSHASSQRGYAGRNQRMAIGFGRIAVSDPAYDQVNDPPILTAGQQWNGRIYLFDLYGHLVKRIDPPADELALVADHYALGTGYQYHLLFGESITIGAGKIIALSHFKNYSPPQVNPNVEDRRWDNKFNLGRLYIMDMDGNLETRVTIEAPTGTDEVVDYQGDNYDVVLHVGGVKEYAGIIYVGAVLGQDRGTTASPTNASKKAYIWFMYDLKGNPVTWMGKPYIQLKDIIPFDWSGYSSEIVREFQVNHGRLMTNVVLADGKCTNYFDPTDPNNITVADDATKVYHIYEWDVPTNFQSWYEWMSTNQVVKHEWNDTFGMRTY